MAREKSKRAELYTGSLLTITRSSLVPKLHIAIWPGSKKNVFYFVAQKMIGCGVVFGGDTGHGHKKIVFYLLHQHLLVVLFGGDTDHGGEY